MSTLLVGNYGSGNLGDELILAAALREYPTAVVMTRDPEFSQQFCEQSFRTIPWPPAGLRSLLHYALSSEYRAALTRYPITEVVFAGGGLWAGSTGSMTSAYRVWTAVLWWLRRLFPTATVRLTHMGFDPPVTHLQRQMLTYVCSSVSTLTVRDPHSLAAIAPFFPQARLAGDRLEATPFPPVAPPSTTTAVVLINALSPVSQPTIAAVQATRPTATLLGILMDPRDTRPPGISTITPRTRSELQALYSGAVAVYAERLHALHCGVKWCPGTTTVLRKPYSSKVQALQEHYHLPSWSS
ncbi:hypothetical protein H6771_02360 [Candidatus Peribacteria bacterium]|nr:hypothetical protein [Candidatus Peribacteria bacterium]